MSNLAKLKEKIREHFPNMKFAIVETDDYVDLTKFDQLMVEGFPIEKLEYNGKHIYYIRTFEKGAPYLLGSDIEEPVEAFRVLDEFRMMMFGSTNDYVHRTAKDKFGNTISKGTKVVYAHDYELKEGVVAYFPAKNVLVLHNKDTGREVSFSLTENQSNAIMRVES